MILPVVAYGDPVLKKPAKPVEPGYPHLQEFIADMYETMHNASGVGLAAPQVGLSIRLFVVDSSSFEKEGSPGFRQVFINPEIKEEEGKEWIFNEGCLSIPGIREDIRRQPLIRIRFADENFVLHEKTYDGMQARIIQHEYDHIEGILFTDHISPLRKRLLKKKLLDISKGIVDVDYRMKFPLAKK